MRQTLDCVIHDVKYALKTKVSRVLDLRCVALDECVPV